MPRTARASVGGICYHVLNRGNARADVFHKDGEGERWYDPLATVWVSADPAGFSIGDANLVPLPVEEFRFFHDGER